MHRALVEAYESRFLFSSILFIRGADRSGGFLEATNDAQRTEQLADINNTSTVGGNHGWGTFAKTLRDAGYAVTQAVEPLEANAPSTGQTTSAALSLDRMKLSQYDVVVFASNNAGYSKKQVNAVDDYVRGGGAALFISDGNFGSSWADAANSDQQFLNRFGIIANQDNGQYVLDRTAGDFKVGTHPIFNGITRIDGEGVSPLRIASTLPHDTSITRLIGAKGETYDNNPSSSANNSRGTKRATNDGDSTLVAATVNAGRVAGFFDRNTFFNDNGAGTDITRYDNRQFALNLFGWLTDNEVIGVASSRYRVEDDGRRIARIAFNDNLAGSLTSGDVKIRNTRTGSILSRSSYALRVIDGDEQSTLLVTLRGSVDPDDYRLEIRERSISDSAGNRRTAAIKFYFTVR